MDNKNIAFYLSETFQELKFLNQKFNLKLLNSDEQDEMFDDYENPFGEGTYNPFEVTPYWLEIRKFIVKDVNPNYKGQRIEFKKILNLDEFKLINIDCSCNEFEYNFFEKAPTSIRNKNSQIIKTPKIETWDFGSKKQEYIGDYLRRIKREFEVDFIYEITFKISNTLEVEYECKELQPDFILKENPNSPPKRVWKQKSIVRDKNNLPQLKKLVVEVCEQLEEQNIYNYIIIPDTTKDEIINSMERDDSLSWGNYDPYGLGL
jgi:hypothetical protein